MAGAALGQGPAHHQHLSAAQHARQGGDGHLDQGRHRLGRDRNEEDPRRLTWPSGPTTSQSRAAARGSPGACASGSTRSRRSEEHTSELQSPCNLVCRLLLEKKKKKTNTRILHRNLVDACPPT